MNNKDKAKFIIDEMWMQRMQLHCLRCLNSGESVKIYPPFKEEYTRMEQLLEQFEAKSSIALATKKK